MSANTVTVTIDDSPAALDVTVRDAVTATVDVTGVAWPIEGGGGLALGETSTTAYRGDRGKTAYDYSQAHTGATDPHGDRAYAAALVDDLSGVTSASTARTNLGLGTAATAASGDFAAASHAHAASAITSGTVDTARLGSGSASASTFLRGDQTWAAAGGGMGNPKASSHYYLGNPTPAAAAFSASWGANYIIITPFLVGTSMPIDRIGTRFSTASGTATLYVGLYLPDATGCYPGTLVVASGLLANGGAAGMQTTTISETLDPGWYWAVAQVGTAASSTAGFTPVMCPVASNVTTFGVSYFQARTNAALPADLSSLSSGWGSPSTNIPHFVWVRAT